MPQYMKRLKGLWNSYRISMGISIPLQFCLWANMLQLGIHGDYENLPNCPMVGEGGKKKSEKKSELVEALSGIAEGVMKAFSCKDTHTPEIKSRGDP